MPHRWRGRVRALWGNLQEAEAYISLFNDFDYLARHANKISKRGFENWVRTKPTSPAACDFDCEYVRREWQGLEPGISKEAAREQGYRYAKRHD